ncbi:MAG: Tm-1-like ATP-binding domain-containing protein [Planctomycetes bacterium]|nr:Tm-1-like ATP-binding domain-containing protein [Planctomycetota bacterium]
MPVYLFATLDTKGVEAGFVRDCLHEAGVETRVVNTGGFGEPAIAADVDADIVFRAGGTSLAAVRERKDRGEAVTAAARGAAEFIRQEHAAGRVAGVLGLGGSAGTTIATAAMRALPLGVPKVMVSTLASGQVRPYVGDKDVFMLNAVVDISGINRISRLVLGQAAAAMAGLVKYSATATSAPGKGAEAKGDRPLIAATMFGVTTPCVERARAVLEDAGYEVLVFHATGTGGQAMESLIADGLIVGVLDITTTELADELVGGVLSAGPERLTAAGKKGVPQVISVGATDMVNFGPPETVPETFRGRTFYHHNPTVTLMRTTTEENRRLGEEIARKAAAATGPTVLVLPLKGVSAIDREGQPFDAPEAREALFEAVRQHRANVELIELDAHINDAAFAEAAAQRLIEMLRSV